MTDININIDIKPMVERALADLQLTYRTLKERGVKYFLRPLLISGGCIFLVYKYFYSPPAIKLNALTKKFIEAQTTLQFADGYKEARDKLLAIYPELPDAKKRDQWLLDTTIELMKRYGMVAETISPPAETSESGALTQKVTVTMTTTYRELLVWLRAVEEYRPLIHIASIDIVKAKESPGEIKVDCSLSTIILQRRLAR